MRVTTQTTRDQRIAEIPRGEERLEAACDHVSSGLRLQRPSDDPDAMGGLHADLDNVISLRADLGARAQYVEWVRQRASDDLLAAQGPQSQLQDADLAAAILDTKAAENAHEATLAVAARLGQTSLLDFLR
jgi:flagellar hook-associated protein 3 FlgL